MNPEKRIHMRGNNVDPGSVCFCEIIVFLCITASKIMQASKIKTGMFG